MADKKEVKEQKAEKPAKKEWVKPPHYMEVEEITTVLNKAGISFDPKVRYAVSHGKVYALDYSVPEYKQWEKDRLHARQAKINERIARVKALEQKRAVSTAKKELTKSKREKVAKINEQIKALQASKKNL